MAEKQTYQNPSEQLEGLRNLIGILIQDALTIVQSGALGVPTANELRVCGQYHELLSAPVLQTQVVKT